MSKFGERWGGLKECFHILLVCSVINLLYLRYDALNNRSTSCAARKENFRKWDCTTNKLWGVVVDDQLEGACRFSYFRKLRGGGGNKWKYLLKSELLAILFVMKWSARNNIYKQISILKFLSTCLVLLQVKQCMKYYTTNSSINIYEPSLKLNHEIFDIIDHRK